MQRSQDIFNRKVDVSYVQCHYYLTKVKYIIQISKKLRINGIDVIYAESYTVQYKN